MPGSDIYSAVRTHLEASWASTPLHFENENTNPAAGGAWVYVEFASSVYGQQSIGARTQAENRWDEEGTVFMYVMVPTGTGAADAYGYARSLVDIFRGVTLMSGRLEFMDATIGYGEHPEEEGNWYRISVNQAWRLVNV